MKLPPTVSCALHRDFMAWFGKAGNLRAPLNREEWLAAAGKCFSLKAWHAQLAEKGLEDLPATRTATMERALRAYLASERGEPGRQTRA